MLENNYTTAVSKPRYLRRWWMKTRPIKGSPATLTDPDGKVWKLPLHEFYCPTWAKPLDFIHKLIFGKPTLVNIEKGK